MEFFTPLTFWLEFQSLIVCLSVSFRVPFVYVMISSEKEKILATNGHNSGFVLNERTDIYIRMNEKRITRIIILIASGGLELFRENRPFREKAAS